MEQEGPILESLTRRLAETPEEFLFEPRIGVSGHVHVAAVAGDLAKALNVPLKAGELVRFAGNDARQDRNRLAITLLFCWILFDEWFRQANCGHDAVLKLLDSESKELASQIAARKFVTDPDRREEMARVTLARLGFRPAGESLAQAQDRLTTLNSTERARVMRAARVAEERARQIREALKKKAAEESADKWTRE
ncbi:MAG TPA: hypothetical protein VH280_10750 [Verrucomicrobiae bacterium]|jgi:hypothetical protein|nr:hypothetical protein [Verrucomicrobiae bacterium]